MLHFYLNLTILCSGIRFDDTTVIIMSPEINYATSLKILLGVATATGIDGDGTKNEDCSSIQRRKHSIRKSDQTRTSQESRGKLEANNFTSWAGGLHLHNRQLLLAFYSSAAKKFLKPQVGEMG